MCINEYFIFSYTICETFWGCECDDGDDGDGLVSVCVFFDAHLLVLVLVLVILKILPLERWDITH